MWIFLPNFLKKTQGILYAISQSFQSAFDEFMTEAIKLKARGMANRLSGFNDYYASNSRQQDLTLQGISRYLFKRISESWDDFEFRIQQFAYDIKLFGTKAGLEAELSRTGLSVSIEELTDDIYSWILLSIADQCPLPEDQLSHIFSLGDENPSFRGDRIYSLADVEIFAFLVRLSGSTAYAKSEIKSIIKQVKPAYTKCFCFYPNAEFAEVII